MTMRIHPVAPTLIALAFSLGACSNETPANATQAGNADSPRVAPSTSNGTATATSAPKSPPAPGVILSDIYNEAGDGSASYRLEDGSVATFWRGEMYELGGKRYYTGFAYHVSKEDGEDDLPGPDATVGLTQATYMADDSGGKSSWTLFHAQTDVGSFGGQAKPDDADRIRQTQSYVMKDGHMLLAIPTSRFADGVKTTGYAILTFDPAKNDLGDYKGWQYLGTAAGGEDNSAACDDTGPMKCAASTGTLTFVAPGSGTMPTLRITLRGSAVSGPSQTRALGNADVRNYVYDPAGRSYKPSLDR